MARRSEAPRRPWNWRLWVGLFGALVFIGMAVTSRFYLPFSLNYAAPEQQFLPPDLPHWLGTDSTGRDLAALALAGSFTSLGIAIGAALLGLLLALPIGFLAVARPRLLGWIAEGSAGLLLALSPLVAAIAGTALFGPRVTIVVVAIGLANFGESARFIRRAGRELWQRPFASAGRLAGLGNSVIAWRHLMPNVLPALTALTLNQVAIGILWEAALSFLGLGAASPRGSFGLMLDDARIMLPGHTWEAVAAGLLVMLAALSFRLLAAGVERARNSASAKGDALATA